MPAISPLRERELEVDDMDTSAFTDAFDTTTDDALAWVSDNGEFLFDYLRWLLEGL